MSEEPEPGARRPLSVRVPTNLLLSMPGMEEGDLRVLLFLVLHERLSPGWRVPARVGQITKGTGLGRTRVQHVLDALVDEGWVIGLVDGTYVLSIPLPEEDERETGHRGGEAGSAGCLPMTRSMT